MPQTRRACSIKRRPLAKSIFNVGQVVTSAGVGALAFVLLHGSTDSLGYAKVAFLGIVQGITELLPISSTAHMRVVPAVLGCHQAQKRIGSIDWEHTVEDDSTGHA